MLKEMDYRRELCGAETTKAMWTPISDAPEPVYRKKNEINEFWVWRYVNQKCIDRFDSTKT